MPTENTSLKITAPAGGSNPSVDIGILNCKSYQRPVLIAAGSLLTLAVWNTVPDMISGGQHLQSSANEIAKDAVALADYQVDSANLALNKDIFGMSANSEKHSHGFQHCPEEFTCFFGCNCPCYKSQGGCIYSCYSCCKIQTNSCSCIGCKC